MKVVLADSFLAPTVAGVLIQKTVCFLDAWMGVFAFQARSF